MQNCKKMSFTSSYFISLRFTNSIDCIGDKNRDRNRDKITDNCEKRAFLQSLIKIKNHTKLD